LAGQGVWSESDMVVVWLVFDCQMRRDVGTLREHFSVKGGTMATDRGGAQDFDFEFGSWRVSHRRLVDRLTGCDDWQSFGGTCDARPILGGLGNVEDNVLEFPGGPVRAVALRSFDPVNRIWAIWWLASTAPHQLDVPVIGRFEDGVGAFYADDTLRGMPVRVRFLWLRTDSNRPRWEQAFSGDNGQTWETNWTMDFDRV
jgi:hypothetical protein